MIVIIKLKKIWASNKQKLSKNNEMLRTHSLIYITMSMDINDLRNWVKFMILSLDKHSHIYNPNVKNECFYTFWDWYSISFILAVFHSKNIGEIMSIEVYQKLLVQNIILL